MSMFEEIENVTQESEKVYLPKDRDEIEASTSILKLFFLITSILTVLWMSLIHIIRDHVGINAKLRYIVFQKEYKKTI